MRPQTIQIHLPYGDPRGLRQAEITTRTVRAFEVPREGLSQFVKMAESTQPGIYLLFGTNTSGSPMCYIGESDNVGKRLGDHNRAKDFWSRAVAVVSLTNSWTKAHVQCLEQTAIVVAQQAAHFAFENVQAGKSTNIPAWMRADCDEFFDTISVLTSTLGYSVFETHRDAEQPRSSAEPASKAPPQLPAAPEIEPNGVPALNAHLPVHLELRNRGAYARGTWDGLTFTVLAGSTARKAQGELKHQQLQVKIQSQLLQDEVLTDQDGKFVFLKDHRFATPSGASAAVIGSSSSGWNDWKDGEGRKLKDIVKR